MRMELNIELEYVFRIQVCVWILGANFMIVDEVIWLQIRRTSTWKSVSEDGISVSVWQTAGHLGFGKAHEWTLKSSGSKSGRQTQNGCGQAIKAVCTQRDLSLAPMGKKPLDPEAQLSAQCPGYLLSDWEHYLTAILTYWRFILYQTNILTHLVWVYSRVYCTFNLVMFCK